MLCQPYSSVTGTILAADDQATNRVLLDEFLLAQGFTVITVGDGDAVLQQTAATQIDLVLLDVMRPKFTGFEVCEKIKNNPETDLIPVVLITALSDKQDCLKGIKAGADDFLTRPVDSTELLACVRSLLKLKFRTNELERAESVLFSRARSDWRTHLCAFEVFPPCTADHPASSREVRWPQKHRLQFTMRF
jgi:DNA-binding response OmpR family regulator